MKIDLNVRFKDLHGHDLQGERKIGDAIAEVLYSSGDERMIAAEDKYTAFKLCTRLAACDGAPIDLNEDEVKLLKGFVPKVFTVGAAGQVLALLENN